MPNHLPSKTNKNTTTHLKQLWHIYDNDNDNKDDGDGHGNANYGITERQKSCFVHIYVWVCVYKSILIVLGYALLNCFY